MASNTLLTPTAVLRESLRVLHQKLKFIGSINRQYDDSFAVSGAKIGDSLKIRLPNQFTVTSSATMSVQDTVEQSVTVQVATQKHVAFEFTSAERTLSIDRFSERYCEPAMAVLAAAMEADALNMIYQTPNIAGAPGTPPADLTHFLTARQRMVENLTPEGNWKALVNPTTSASLVGGLKSLFQSSEQISKQYTKGYMGTAAGFDFMESTLLPTLTSPADIVVTVSGASQTGSSLTIAGVTNPTTFPAGLVFTLPGVYAVHPETKVATSVLQQFTITASTTIAATSGSIPIFPAITITGARQTVSASPTDTNSLTFLTGNASTGYQQNICYHPDAYTFVTADLVLPKNQEFVAREVYDGISMRIWQGSDITNDKFPCRIDVLYGYKAVRPQLACRVSN